MPPPVAASRVKFNFKDMKVGEKMFVPVSSPDFGTVHLTAYKFAAKYGWGFTIRKVTKGGELTRRILRTR